MKNRIYHNPRCTKSRQALQLLNENNIDIEVIEYLKMPPTSNELKSICALMGVQPKQLVRLKEPLAKELGITTSTEMADGKCYKIMSENPKLIERPIVVYNGKVVLGRPPEKILQII